MYAYRQMLTFRKWLPAQPGLLVPSCRFRAETQRPPGAPWHGALLFRGTLEDSRENLGLFTPPPGRHADCGPEDRSSWAVKVNRLPLPHRPDCVTTGSGKNSFRCLDFQGRARPAHVSCKPQKGPAPVLSKCFSLVDGRGGQGPGQVPVKCLGSAALWGSQGVYKRQEDEGEARTETCRLSHSSVVPGMSLPVYDNLLSLQDSAQILHVTGGIPGHLETSSLLGGELPPMPDTPGNPEESSAGPSPLP